jgi:hypothetical protein
MRRITAGTEPKLGSKKIGAAVSANSTTSNQVVSGP